MKEFKELYSEFSGKTLAAITHGVFLNVLVSTFTNNISVQDHMVFIPANNSLTILDFFMNKHEVGGEQREFVDVKLTAHNLIIH